MAMVYFILIWALLIVTSYPIGLIVVNRLSSDSFQRQGDRFIASIWLGVILIANFLLSISLFLPLSILVGAGAVTLLVALSLLLAKTRAEMTNWIKLSSSVLLGTGILALIVALLTTYEVTWIESGFYHYGSIRWLSEFGAVPGTVLLLPNFGIISSWFALSAPFNSSIIDLKAGAVANGFIILLSVLHGIVSASRLLAHRGKLSDYFAVSFYGLFFLYVAFSEEMQLVTVSPSPDLPIVLLTGLVSWAMLVALEGKRIGSAGIPDAIVALLLAIGAVTIKLSALPLLLAAGIFYLVLTKFKVKPLLLGLILGSLLLLPILSVGFRISGCPLYPAPSFCQNVPWSQPIAETQKFADNTQNPGKWVRATGVDRSPIGIFSRWFQARTLNKIMAGLGVLSGLCFIYLIRVAAIAGRSSIFWVSAVGVVGILFITFKGPLIRLGLGYFLIPPAISIAAFAYTTGHGKLDSIWRHLGKQQVRAIALAALTAAIAASFAYGGLSSRWLLPPQVRSTSLIIKQVNDVKYFVPQQGPCWASALPCSVPKWRVEAKLRDPALGIRGGFVRSSVGKASTNNLSL